MVVDSIGMYELKGPYCTLTMTDWFLQALSVIPSGSWSDVARRFTMIRLIKRLNVSNLTYESFPGGHSSQYFSPTCTLNSTILPPPPPEIVLPVKIWCLSFTVHLANQIKLLNFNSLTYETSQKGNGKTNVVKSSRLTCLRKRRGEARRGVAAALQRGPKRSRSVRHTLHYASRIGEQRAPPRLVISTGPDSTSQHFTTLHADFAAGLQHLFVFRTS
ncbi:hypothetical protein F511_33902 [Dorcoceras hygrometricum]|uniref:Uncharacterized protein n=1 Tax=Dorcoceras hygrometricum TaxID=472368 RepID=A0A2Z7B0U0_9LAMI|nr:hypothetical protein F511_33902 [Dorcoceras hygrometricum]